MAAFLNIKEKSIGLRKSINAFFNPTHQTGQLLKETAEQKERLLKLHNEFQEAMKWRGEFNDSLSMLTSYLGAMFWKKDKELEYILASPTHCRDFFNLIVEETCLRFILGRTAMDLIDEIFIQNGIKNTFGNVCEGSDLYTKEKMETCHFFEAGLIDKDQMLLYVIKKPIIKDGAFDGLYSLAWDVSEYSETMMNLLNRWIYADQAEAIHLSKDAFIYSLVPDVQRCDVFSHICPFPEKHKYKEVDRCQGFQTALM